MRVQGTYAVILGAIFVLFGTRLSTLEAQAPVEAAVDRAGLPAVLGTNSNNANDSDGVRGTATGTGRNAGVVGRTASATNDSAGVRGIASAGGGKIFGVFGSTLSTANDSAGLFGLHGANRPASWIGSRPAGVRGESQTGVGILGISELKGIQGWGTGNGPAIGVEGNAMSTTARLSAGVYGWAGRTDADVFGVVGETRSQTEFAAGVRGLDGSGDLMPPGTILTAGVRGESRDNTGVLGVSRWYGVAGAIFNAGGVQQAIGILGHKFQNDYYSIWTSGRVRVSGTQLNPGSITATGVISGSRKDFVEPHPTDASKIIRYSSLEGAESGTYVRGTAATIGGEATLEVPESFRIVTQEKGITVQLTPIGELATLAVVSRDLHRIVVRSSADVSFDYFVQGVRRSFPDLEAIVAGNEFVPDSASALLPEWYPPEYRARLIANGTYNPDGTVNLETAKRLGWFELWARPAPASANKSTPE